MPRRLGMIALALQLALGGARAWAAQAKTPDAAKVTGQKAADGDDQPDDSKPEHTLPPVIEAAIAEKEKEVGAARKEGIRLLEDFLRSSPKSRETAEALYKLAEIGRASCRERV